MEESLWKVLLAAIALIQLTHAQVDTLLPEPGKLLKFPGGEYHILKADFPLLDNETVVVWSRNVGPKNIFAYATHDPSKKYAVIKVVGLKEDSTFRKQRCEFDFDVPDDSTVMFDSMRIVSDGHVFSVSFTWHIKGNESDSHLDTVNSITCSHAETFRQLKGKKSTAEVSVSPAASGTETADLAKLETAKGYLYVDKANNKADESVVHINYANATNRAVMLTSTIEHRPRVDGLWVESLELNRYGACWEADMVLHCAQGPLQAEVNSSELTEWASLPLPRYHDWLGVINYAEDRMLLIMGDSRGYCTPSKNCDYFLLYEVRPNGGIYRHQGTHISLGGCIKPAELTIDSFDHDNGTCFSMACVGFSDSKRTLKYRQTCARLV